MSGKGRRWGDGVSGNLSKIHYAHVENLVKDMKFTDIYTANVENLDFSVENRLNIVNKQTFSVEKPVNSV